MVDHHLSASGPAALDHPFVDSSHGASSIVLASPTEANGVPEQSSTQTYRLPPRTENDLKAAVTATMPGHSPGIMRWTIYKELLRWTSLILGIVIVVAEALVAVVSYGSIDTMAGIPWGFLIGCWDAWYMIRKRKGKSIGPMLLFGIVCEGLCVASGLAVFIGFAYFLKVQTYSIETIRVSILLIGVFVLTGMHTVLFIRAWLEHHRRANIGRGVDIDLHQSTTAVQTQAAQIIVQYVHTCSQCGRHPEPQPGQPLNEALAARGETQPQYISPAQLGHVH